MRVKTVQGDCGGGCSVLGWKSRVELMSKLLEILVHV